jgi:beta-phosphoglucomutase
MKYKAILFDLDGTIIHTEAFWLAATVQILNKNPDACPILKQELAHQLIGRALHDSCRLIKETLELSESIDELILEKESCALDLYRDNVTFLKGFETFFLHATQDHGLKTAIASNSTLKTLAVAKAEAKLHSFFADHIYSFEHVDKKAKPHPDLFLHAAKQLGVAPKECIVIEDSIAGVQAAKAANMFCIRIIDEKTPHKKSAADITVHEYAEIDLNKIMLQ